MRLFVALEVTEEVRERIREVMPDLRKHCPGARWVRPEGIHITLKFIGQVEAAKAEAIREALRMIRSDQPVRQPESTAAVRRTSPRSRPPGAGRRHQKAESLPY